ncbi:hypothetical protein [Formicincola oecophyllae]|nr:hypothetical protein [Formicincola oecophyllae]
MATSTSGNSGIMVCSSTLTVMRCHDRTAATARLAVCLTRPQRATQMRTP